MLWSTACLWVGEDKLYPSLLVSARWEGKEEGEAKTSPEHRKHISEMSSQGFSAYTRTVSGPVSTNGVMEARGIRSGSNRKRQKYYLVQCLKHGFPDNAPTVAFNPWSWGCIYTRLGPSMRGANMLQHSALRCQPKWPCCEAAPCADAHSHSGSRWMEARQMGTGVKVPWVLR